MSSNTTNGIGGDHDHDRDHKLHETLLLSTKLIVESQEAMLLRIIEASSAAATQTTPHRNIESIETMLRNNVKASTDAVETMLRRNSEASNAVMEAMLHRIEVSSAAMEVLLRRNGEAGSSGDEEEDEAVENNLSDHNNQQEDGANQEDDQINEENEEDQIIEEELEFDLENNCGVNTCQSLFDAVDKEDWETAAECVIRWASAYDIEKAFKTWVSTRKIGTILVKAADEQQWDLVEEIVSLTPSKALEYCIPNIGLTILHQAAMFGTIEVVKKLVRKHPKLTLMPTTRKPNMVPLILAAKKNSSERKKVLEYLYPVTRDYFLSIPRGLVSIPEGINPFSGANGRELVYGLISINSFGTALSVCRQFPELFKEIMLERGNLLKMIVERPFAFLSGANLAWWERGIYSLIEVDVDREQDYGVKEVAKSSKTSLGSSGSDKGILSKCISFLIMRYLTRVHCITQLRNQKLMHVQAVALVKHVLHHLDKTMDKEELTSYIRKTRILEIGIEYRNTESVLECLTVFPFLCWDTVLEPKIMKMVIGDRNELIFNFICKQKEVWEIKGFNLDKHNNGILHYTAELATNRQLNSISGAVFQMQKEMQWFKGVENAIEEKDRFLRNKDGNTAQFLFTENHKKLMEKGEKWMKDTSGSCMLVGALIATVAFAATFTVPGGNINDINSTNNGIPVFLTKPSFMVFAIGDALALFSSITSVLMFLAVYTSRYSEDDFLKSLPKKLVIGLVTLFFSMATILVSFGAAFTIVLQSRFVWAPIVVALFGCVPVFLFGFLQFPLFVEMVRSTYWPTIFWKRGIIKKSKNSNIIKKSKKLNRATKWNSWFKCVM